MAKSQLILIGLTALTLAAVLLAPSPADTRSLEVHTDAELSQALAEFRAEFGFPGATAAYILPGGQVYAAATGMADVEAGVPMETNTRMLAASIGKGFTGALAVQLALECKLDLDTPIACWLGSRPWFEHLPSNDRLTLRQLLTHSSGLPDHVYEDDFATAFADRWDKQGRPFVPEELLAFILNKPVLFEPSEGWAYSDSGYILAGLAIEEAAGVNCMEEIQHRFLLPLGLDDTSALTGRLVPGLANGYMPSDNRFGLPARTLVNSGQMAWDPSFEWTGGGLVSSSTDLAKWGAALYGGEAMPGCYLDCLLDSVPISAESNDICYGMGVAVYHTGPFGPVYGHAGWIPGYVSSLRYYADHGIAIAFQVNTDIGMKDGNESAVQIMEYRLAEIAIAAAGGLR